MLDFSSYTIKIQQSCSHISVNYLYDITCTAESVYCTPILSRLCFLPEIWHNGLKLLNVCLFRADADSTSETRDTFSDSFSDESESEKLSRWDGCSSEEWVFEQENLWHQNDRLGHLYCQYFEKSTPYGRVPLMDKVPFTIHSTFGPLKFQVVTFFCFSFYIRSLNR